MRKESDERSRGNELSRRGDSEGMLPSLGSSHTSVLEVNILAGVLLNEIMSEGSGSVFYHARK